MLLPDPDARRPMEPADFLKCIDDDERRDRYSAVLERLDPLAGVIRERFFAVDGIPDLRIIKNAPKGDTELRDIVGAVFIADGLLDWFFEIDEFTRGFIDIQYPFGKWSVAKIGAMWAYAHEVFHFVRRHALVEKHFGKSRDVRHALEFDADMCAVAVIYRFVQFKENTGDELQLKMAVLKSLFFIVRAEIDQSSIKEYEGSPTHPHTAARLWDLVCKLSMLHDTGRTNPDFVNPISIQHSLVMLDMVKDLERKYLMAKNRDFESSVIGDFLCQNSELKFTRSRHEQWDEISRLIDYFSTLPREDVDNDKSIGFIVNGLFSMPSKHSDAGV
ncbi:hypothetical protein [Chitiniphilus eburneus]|uniref:hypothetical protein n=1 Tax=Chitiniphilus eburneus TaxID=2571148 RepID=UPI0035CF8984